MCGDYTFVAIFLVATVDTTPRVRGLPCETHEIRRVERYNPACAGTTAGRHSPPRRPSIQPRVCGDYGASVIAERIVVDTTPRVRGLPPESSYARTSQRYNPACAGTTAVAGDIHRYRPIQPRVCGDYNVLLVIQKEQTDTTPRVRGLPPASHHATCCTRYNPACAGTTRNPH